MLDKIDYNQNFTTNYVKAQDKSISYKDPAMLNYSAISFTREVFSKYPELLGLGAQTLMYIQYAGRAVKPEMLYDIFENMMTNTNIDIIKSIVSGKNPYNIEQDGFILWARLLYEQQKIVTFEPSMNICTEILNNFIKNDREFIYKTRPLRMYDVKPIMYTNVGENISDLLPYIAYIYNFFINGNPYLFNDLTSGSNIQLFLNNVNDVFNIFYSKLIKEGRNVDANDASQEFFNLDHFFSDVDHIKKFNTGTVIQMYEKMLSTDTIIPIRTRILVDSITDEDVEEQTSIPIQVCKAGFMNVLENLFEIVVNKNYITLNVFDKIPMFDPSVIDYHTLSLINEYCITGGNQLFNINTNEEIEGCLESNNIGTYPTIPPQHLDTDISTNSLSSLRPFISSNLYSTMTSGYVISKFIEHQNDVFNNEPIIIDESLLDTEKFSDSDISEKLISLYVNGKWMCHNSQLIKLLEYLMSIQSFKNEMQGIHYLGRIFATMLGKKANASILPAYILSFLPEYILNFMIGNSQQSVNNFSLMTYFCLHHRLEMKRIQKLIDIEKSIMFMYNKKYTRFVNSKVGEFIKILSLEPYIVQPYAKGISNNIDMYAIGGISLVGNAIYANPLIRAYSFIVSTQGVSQELQTFYEWTRGITSEDVIELLNTSINEHNTVFLKELLIKSYDRQMKTNNIPNTLLNYNVDKLKENKGQYTMKTYPYFIDLLTKNGIRIYDLLGTYTFPVASAKDTQPIEIITRSIDFKTDKFIAKKPLKGFIDYNGQQYAINSSSIGTDYDIPYYDYSADFRTVVLAFEKPSIYKLLQLYTPNGVNFKNNLFYIFTKVDVSLFGDKKYSMAYQDVMTNKLPTMESSVGRISGIPNVKEQEFETNRVVSNGISRKVMPM